MIDYTRSRFLEMLIVLDGIPVATPFEPVLHEQTVAEVALRDLVLELLLAVDIGFTRSGLDKDGTVLLPAYTRVVERIDIDGKTTGMIRELGTAFHHPVAVARGVVGTHRSLIIIPILRDRTHALNRIFRLVKLREDLLQVLRNRLVTDKDTHLCLPLPVDMLNMQGVEDNTVRLPALLNVKMTA